MEQADHYFVVDPETDPQNALEESFERRVMDALWGIPDPKNVEDPLLAAVAEHMQETADEYPELVPDELSANLQPRRSEDHPHTTERKLSK